METRSFRVWRFQYIEHRLSNPGRLLVKTWGIHGNWYLDIHTRNHVYTVRFQSRIRDEV